MAVGSRAQWLTARTDRSAAGELAARLGLPDPLGRVLLARGLTDVDAAAAFLNPRLSDLSDPFDLPGMEPAVERVWSAIRGRQEIAVFGDYDADGLTSTALLVLVLKQLGAAEVRPFVPNRLTDGYGLSVAALDRCLGGRRPHLLLTADCGTSSVDTVQMANDQGIDVVVTDHHEPGQALAPALAVVNPKLRPDARTQSLAGVGVAFKLCHALVKRAMESGHPVGDLDLRRFLSLVAIGTVADVVALRGENRILVRHGLARLNSDPPCGIEQLMAVAGLQGEVNAYHLGFVIGPRLNAPGRMGSADESLKLLLASDPADGRRLALFLEEINEARKRLQNDTAKEAQAEVDAHFDPERDYGLVVGREGWHVGTLGIVASELCSRYERPSVLIGFDGDGLGRGSCRSSGLVDLVDALQQCSDLLVSHGGHKMAAGVTIRADRYEAFRERFNSVCAGVLRGRDRRPVLPVDAWISLGQADDCLLAKMSLLAPFGMDNPTPTWGARNLRLIGPPRVVGGKHLKMVLASGGTQTDAIGFGMAERTLPDEPLDVIFHLKENLYHGRRSIQLHVKDFRSVSARPEEEVDVA